MAKIVKRSHIILVLTFASTIWMYNFFGLSNFVIACFGTGMTIATVNLVSEEISRK
ncbi:hypothetical protein [Peribacillus frigoritolerans]|uniref:hypothetical protein n=1 Tax=Peribacillus frigoritolerans TaxID=450367 RepID=UPI002EA77572|nr:hypothetical protein [Peribacillus frigoritolerans]